MEDENFKRIISDITSGRTPALISGAGALSRAHGAAAIKLLTGRPLLAICADEGEAGRMAEDLAAFTGLEVPRLFGRDFVFYNAEGVSREGERARLRRLNELSSAGDFCAVTTPDALMLRTMPPKALSGRTLKLKMGGEYAFEGLAPALVSAGYERTTQVEGPGQFAVRGGILDVFSPAQEYPVRCEFFGDEIDSMGYFDVSSQRRTENAEEYLILPSREVSVSATEGGREEFIKRLDSFGKSLMKKKRVSRELLENVLADLKRVQDGRELPAADRYLDLIYSPATALDYLPRETIIVMSEPGRLKERAKNFTWQLSQDILALTEANVFYGGPERLIEDWESLVSRAGGFGVVMMANFTASSYPLPPKTIASIASKQLPSYGGSLETAASDIAHYKNTGSRVLVLVRDKRRGEILKEFLERQGIGANFDFALTALPRPGECRISLGGLSAGLEYPSIKLAIITEGQIMQKLFRRKAKKKLPSNRQKLDSFTDLSPGDLVVHEQYGIGRFVGMVKWEVDGVLKDYIKIAYAGSDNLLIPATQLDAVTKYIGAGEDTPVKLSKLGGADWGRAKTRAKAAVKELADGLIKLQAERQKATGHAFPPDTPWQREFEDNFEYQETDDQLRAIREIKADMESPVPMDRLLCGDVGYGKTEVAMRAVMKCVMDGMQAAILVPTTVLAQQHYQTAARRFDGFPVRIEVLSRFRSTSEIRRALRGMADGSVDIVIGTHKLLQKDVRFKRLGLLVVDEEQRFGVTHKERLKELSRKVDVLTLSATPIPRTLNMALSGVRDMSTIEEPPSDRQPVQTYVMEHDWGILLDAIRREVSRGGQVYYLHNRVENIERTAVKIRDMLGDVTVGVAHGRMDEDELRTVMEAVENGQIQVLVCTTIIETGIDIPNVNTLIIEDADKMGLAQLHQIRGRVGRSSRRAYAYFTFKRDKLLSEVAEKRLSAIREFAEFNSGFKIAMRDLEIRGAGNILGAEQSGHMMSVGYDLYLKLLEEAVQEERGEKPEVRAECSADLAVSASIPESYVSSTEQRMDLYRRMAHIRTAEDADDMMDELMDRFGDPPPSVESLIRIALLRGEAASAGISEISQKNGRIIFCLRDFDMEKISKLYSTSQYRGRLKVEAGQRPAVSLTLRPGEQALSAAVSFVRAYQGQ